ncbi:MAG: hypothetical protein IJJ28_03730 [Lentisphaeria bacterium]|nr:hypothetical protein [Lentisphaeria bacterium]
MTAILRRAALAAAAVLMLAAAGGCRSHVRVNGKSYAMLNAREERELVLLARETLIRNSKKLITAEETSELRRREPELDIEYRGDCFGEAVVAWDLPRIKLEVVYEGQLNDPDPRRRGIFVRTMKKYPPVLDLRKEQRRRKTPAKRQP